MSSPRQGRGADARSRSVSASRSSSASLLTVAIGGGVLYAWGRQYDGRVLPGVSVGSTELGGLTREQAEAKVASAYASLGSGEITLTGPDGQMSTISYADVGRGPDTSSLVDAALAAGRQGEPIANLIGGPQAAINGVTLDSAVTYDRDKLAAAVDSLATTIDQTPMDAFVSAGQDGTYSVSPAKDGRAVDKAALLTALEPQLAALGTPASIAMAVPVVPLAPAVPTASAEAATAAADRMAADVVVTRGKDSWTIAGKSLAPLISFSTAADGTITPVFDESGLDPMLRSWPRRSSRSRRTRASRWSADTSSPPAAATRAERSSSPARRPRSSGRSGPARRARRHRRSQAVVKAVDPKLTIADAKAFAGKMRIISSYSVYYWVIINNHWGGNIEGPATVINGTVVPAGGKFDFWKVVGDLHDAPGTGPGNAIEGGKITVTGAFGGGICTTSTTLFNAAFRAGMVPLARQNHNEFIDRYPPGLDATVWIVGKAKQTMSFRNDTKYPILISRTVTNAGNKRWLTFKIWSVPNGRSAKVTNTVIQPGRVRSTRSCRIRPSPWATVPQQLPGERRQGVATVSIYDHGKLHWRKRYFSRYPAVNGVSRRGDRLTRPEAILAT